MLISIASIRKSYSFFFDSTIALAKLKSILRRCSRPAFMHSRMSSCFDSSVFSQAFSISFSISWEILTVWVMTSLDIKLNVLIFNTSNQR